jgi:hypothetical protein
MPITLIGSLPVGAGTPGPHSLELTRRYWERHADPRWSTAVQYDPQH